MDKKLVFRLLLVPLLLYFFYLLKWPIEIIAVLGVLFILIILLRGKIWNAAEKTIEKYLPFTRTWPGWAQKLLLILVFFLIYVALKQILFFILGLFGIDLQEMVMSTYNINKP